MAFFEDSLPDSLLRNNSNEKLRLAAQEARSTRYSAIGFYILMVVLSDSLYHLFANTRAGARCADKTRQAIAFEQLRSRRTHIIVYAGGYFEIFETLQFVQLVLQLPSTV